MATVVVSLRSSLAPLRATEDRCLPTREAQGGDVPGTSPRAGGPSCRASCPPCTPVCSAGSTPPVSRRPTAFLTKPSASRHSFSSASPHARHKRSSSSTIMCLTTSMPLPPPPDPSTHLDLPGHQEEDLPGHVVAVVDNRPRDQDLGPASRHATARLGQRHHPGSEGVPLADTHEHLSWSKFFGYHLKC
jgi:hypothetical protein